MSFRASTAWAELSSACHHHAYELAPSPGEAQRLVDEVSRLRAAASGDERR